VEHPTEDTDDLIGEVRGLRGDVRALNSTVADERRGRKLTNRLAAVLVVALMAIGVNWVRDGRTTCAEKRERAAVADERVLIVVRRASIYANLTEAERADFRGQVVADLNKLPPPC